MYKMDVVVSLSLFGFCRNWFQKKTEKTSVRVFNNLDSEAKKKKAAVRVCINYVLNFSLSVTGTNKVKC